jgi:glycerophosphoryl diester phosphodiesterase
MIPPPVIIAHRGLHAIYPENSLPAFAAAWSAGFLWCECDVHLSRDGVEVVIHDNELDRMTSGRGRVADFTWKQLSRMRLVGADGAPTEHTIPSLDQVYEQMPAGCQLLVETKPKMGERIYRVAEKIIKRGGGLQSFEIEDVELAIGRFGESLKCAGLSETCDRLKKSIRRWNLDFKCLDAAMARKLHKAGFFFGAWTPNDAGDIRKLVRLGIDAIITDEPHIAQRIIADSLGRS